MKLTPTTTLAALVLIGAGGFFAGRITSNVSSAGAKDSAAETRTSRSSSRDSTGDVAGTRQSSRTAKTDRLDKGSAKDRFARLEGIVRDENPLERNRAFLAFIDQLAPGDFQAAIDRFTSLGMSDNRKGELSLLLTAWAQADPLSAMAYSTKNPGDGFVRDTLLTSWATHDAEAAIRWAKSNFTGDGPNPFLPGIIRGLSESDPARATELLASMPRSEERGKGLEYILPHLLEQGAAATQAWISSLTDDSLRNGAMMRSAAQLAETDPAGTAAWLLANPGEAAQRRIDDVYGVWANRDKQAALSSFNALPAGDDRSNALRGLVSSMATEDPKSALSLIDRNPNDVTDAVVQNLIWHSFGTNPSLAVNEISRIADPGQREQMYRRTLDTWIDRDPATAQAWIQANPLPEAIQNHLNRRAAQQ